MKSFALSTVAALAVLLPTAQAQTHTDCFPLNTTGCPSMQALGSNATFDFIPKGIPSNDKIWKKQNQGKIDWDEKDGATFTIERSGDSPMVQSNFYMLFGRLEVIMKAAKGRGIVSSAILQSEALDEIDWEFLGSNDTHTMTNYFVRLVPDIQLLRFCANFLFRAKATPRPTTAAKNTPWNSPKKNSTTTPLTGPRTASNGGSTTRCCVNSYPRTRSTAETTHKPP
jgi:hypothetical protein